ncbi:hypothetical protein K7711_36710 [Nocardia sp. CA2R105]|uniref:WXG100 family type VII secretion target n=1 Tax=Nocardia coffeae TaxID=2873381 RepID=UPI001CA748DF|nr:WXG100 family type VII secretion target [Nocardia coffeae]MBY8862067.1 hypothetical protein [Nocardia coffeae]
MSESLWVDTGAMRASARELDQVADETARMVAELKAALGQEGDCWGNDEPGETFAKTYVPGEKQGMEGMDNLVAAVRAMGVDLRNITDSFENQDDSGATQVRTADPANTGTSTTDPPPISSPTSGYPNQSARPTQQSTGSPGTPTTAADNTGSGPSDSAARPATSTNQQQPAARQQPGSSESGSPGNSSAPADDGSNADQQQADQQQPTEPAPSTAAPNTPATPATRGADARTSTTPANPNAAARNISARPAAATPWARNAARSSTPETANSPESRTPPRVSPPRKPDRPPSPAKPGEEKRRATPARREPAAVRPRPETDDEALRILREMAARHGLEITGFEATGVAEQTAQDIADAVDAVLTKYSILLRGIAIAASGPMSHVENRCATDISYSGADFSQTPEPWIVLTRAAVEDPGLLIERDRVATRSADKTERRPMYATMLLELGHVLDLTGRLRARHEAQRALITEYLRISGAQANNLGHIVSGYKRWRAQLDDYSFDNDALSPGRALAAGFAAVEMHGGKARGPAKVLHRLLVVMARAAVPDRR